MYERFLSLIEQALEDNLHPGQVIVKLAPTASTYDVDRLLDSYPDAPAAFLIFIRNIADGGRIELKDQEIFMDLHSIADFIRNNQILRDNLSIAQSFYEVATYGGCGDSVVVDVRDIDGRGRIFDLDHEAPDQTFDNKPLALTLPSFLERVAEELIAGRSPFFWY